MKELRERFGAVAIMAFVLAAVIGGLFGLGYLVGKLIL